MLLALFHVRELSIPSVNHRLVEPAAPPHALPDQDWVSENVALLTVAPRNPEVSMLNSDRIVDTPLNAWYPTRTTPDWDSALSQLTQLRSQYEVPPNSFHSMV